jgi:ElaB/YqjD/DUF883 family membrane-anchored ribosome-binding protein
MDEARRMRRQIQAVLVIFRAEKRRLESLIQSGDARQEQLDSLRARSVGLLDDARDQLDGNAAWHPQLLKELAEARAEISAPD